MIHHISLSIVSPTTRFFFSILQIDGIVLDLASSMKMETVSSILSVSLLVGAMLDRMENLSTDALVSLGYGLCVYRLLRDSFVYWLKAVDW